MSFAFHGNYCGPGWTAGKYMNAADATEEDFKVPAVDAMDKICKYHDLQLWRAAKELDPARKRAMVKQADQVFVNDMLRIASPGMKDEMMAYAVWAGGAGQKLRTKGRSFLNLQCRNKSGITGVTVKRIRLIRMIFIQ